jgi:MPBQ/MSBQ methyltransferase
MNDSLDEETRRTLEAYLSRLYAGVFTPDAIAAHLENHIGFAFAEYATQVIAPQLPKGAKVLDIGAGFGSCVLAARNVGLDAAGIELAAFEVDFARVRLRRVRPQDDPDTVYRCADVTALDLPPSSIDAITLWNVIEHIEKWESVLDAATRCLKPGGLIFIICPNYMAWRDEAHYHVPWKPAPLLPRAKAIEYLRSLGRDPAYFENSIFYRTNREVLDALEARGYQLLELGNLAPRALSFRRIFSILWSPLKHWRFHSPFRHSVEVAARKPMDA